MNSNTRNQTFSERNWKIDQLKFEWITLKKKQNKKIIKCNKWKFVFNNKEILDLNDNYITL